jgi:hypothetical protein
MEDGDSDAGMADYGTDFSDDDDPNVTRESGIGSPVFRVPFFGGDFPGDSRFPIGRESGVGKRAVSRFGRDRESGSPGAVCRGFPGLGSLLK